MKVTTKNIKKEDRLLMKSPPPIGIVCKVCFSNSNPISGVSFLNNMSIPQVWVNMKETDHDTTFETS